MLKPRLVRFLTRFLTIIIFLYPKPVIITRWIQFLLDTPKKKAGVEARASKPVDYRHTLMLEIIHIHERLERFFQRNRFTDQLSGLNFT